MKFFSFYEIIFSIFLSIFTGVIYGGIYCASETIVIFFKNILFVIPNSIKIVCFAKGEIIKECGRKRQKKLGGIEKNIFDAIIFLLFGIGLVFLSYVALDGYIRLYLFVTCGIFFIISKRFFGRIFIIIFDKILGIIYYVSLLLFCFLFLPVQRVFRLIFICIKSLIAPIYKRIKTERSNKIVKMKLSLIYRVIK